METRRLPTRALLLIALAIPTTARADPTPDDCSATTSNPSDDYAPTSTLELPVVVHIIMDGACEEGAVPDETVADQLRVLNEDYLALPGSNGEDGADSQIRFALATEDPSGQPTTGITRNCDDTWFADDGDYPAALAWDPQRYVNIYVNTASNASGYVPFLPAVDSDRVGTPEDRVVINHLAFGVGGPIPRRAHGRTATHELGHYLGLYHPYFGGCGDADPPGCYATGDLLCDTAPDPASHDGCQLGVTGCGGVEAPVQNHMELSDDDCKRGFTPEQVRRMRCTLQHYRPGLAAGTASTPDAGPTDARLADARPTDAGAGLTGSGGCGCRAGTDTPAWPWALIAIAGWLRARRRR